MASASFFQVGISSDDRLLTGMGYLFSTRRESDGKKLWRDPVLILKFLVERL